MLLLALFLAMDANQSIDVLKTYEPFPKNIEEFLTSPYAVDFTPQGELLIADSKTSRIHIWSKDGKYRKSFGQPGQGPGEVYFPAQLVATTDKIWVWDFSGRLFSFDHEGNYIEMVNIGYNAHVFAVLNRDLLLVAYHKTVDATNNRMIVALINGKGEPVKILKDYQNESYLKPREGFNKTEVRAFGPDVDIQRRGDKWYFGYSQERILYEVDSQGNITGQKHFAIPTEKPTDEDKEYFKGLTYNLITGKTLALSSITTLTHNFDHDKSYYTHFMFKGDEAIFILTPIGGKKGCGNGFHRATYCVNNWSNGKATYRGKYDFHKDSAVYYRSGRVLALLVDDDGEYQIKEIALKTHK